MNSRPRQPVPVASHPHPWRGPAIPGWESVVAERIATRASMCMAPRHRNIQRSMRGCQWIRPPELLRRYPEAPSPPGTQTFHGLYRTGRLESSKAYQGAPTPRGATPGRIDTQKCQPSQGFSHDGKLVCILAGGLCESLPIADAALAGPNEGM